MHFSKTITCALILFGYTGVAFADNTIVLWQEPGDPDIPPSAYTIVQDDKTITIHDPGGYIFRFYAHDGSGTPGTGIIDNISVDKDATGNFTLQIEHPDGYAGALDWNEGNLEYAGGTSTILGIKVAGNLAADDKDVVLEVVTGPIDVGGSVDTLNIDQLDGSIEVAGSVWIVDIAEWLSPSPACIHVAGDAYMVWVRCGSDPNTPVQGDVRIDGHTNILDIYTDFAGSIDIGEAGMVRVYGDILDSGDNYVRIDVLDSYGNFRCDDMQLSGDEGDQWLKFGPGSVEGTIGIYGELSGVLCLDGSSESNIYVGDINAGPTGNPKMQYGGICFAGATSCDVTVTGSLKQGWILASGGSASGNIEISGSVGQEDPSTVARILTTGVPIDFGWDLIVSYSVWPSLGGEAVVYSAGDLSGTIAVGYNPSCNGTLRPGALIQIDGSILGDLRIGGWVSSPPMQGELLVGGKLDGYVLLPAGLAPSGYVRVDGDLGASGRLQAAGNPGTHLEGAIEVLGDLLGEIDVESSNIAGRIHVYGSFDAPGLITANAITAAGAIAIDYDGWDEADYWHEGATVNIGGTPYDGNTPEEHIWEIQHCKGDMNNNGELDSEDPDVLWHVVNDPNYDYATEFPGLDGSLDWHGDLDCLDGITEVDVGALAFFAKDPPCCLYDAECTEYEACRADLDRDGEVKLEDLAILLATYPLCEGDPDFNPDADFDNDGCVGLSDLAHLLGVYGEPCSCFGGGEDGGGGDGSGGAGVSVAMEAYDTDGFEDDGFAGERDHFVFDLTVEVLDDAGDWTAAGVAVRAENGAAFRLAVEPTFVDPLASFVRAPQGVDADGPDAGTFVAGAFSPVGPLYDFEPELINLCWFDRVDSLDGPAAIMRLVIDVSNVQGADVSDGFGSVYFSTGGPLNPSDILVSEMQSETGTAIYGSDMFPLMGRFYVKGQ